MASKKTIVKGIRASQEFFDKCDLVAKAKGMDRNKLIVRVLGEYCDNYYKTYHDIFKLYCRIEEWKRKIIDTSRITYYVSDLKIIREAWDKFLKYIIDNDIEIDLFKILNSLFVEEKYKSIFHKKDYFLFEMIETKNNFDKVMPDGYMKDLMMKAFDKEIEDSHNYDYTYTVVDILKLQNFK